MRPAVAGAQRRVQGCKVRAGSVARAGHGRPDLALREYRRILNPHRRHGNGFCRWDRSPQIAWKIPASADESFGEFIDTPLQSIAVSYDENRAGRAFYSQSFGWH